MKKFDLHTHYLPKSYVDALKKNIDGDPDGWSTPDWQPETTLNFMDDNEIQYSVLSLSSPHINFGDKSETLYLANDANSLGQNLTQQYPDKLGYFASLPLPYESESVEVVKNALDHQQALGVTVPTNSRGTYFGSPVLEKVYQALNDRNAIVALHPNEPANLPKNVDIGFPTPLLGFFMDTTMTFVNMLKYRFFNNYPNIKIIIPHAGAFLGILDDRISEYVQKEYHEDIFQIMKSVYFDTAGSVLPRQLPTLLSLADSSHIIYGSDIPYTPLAKSAKLGQELENTDILTNDQKVKIFTSNAKSLLQH